MRETIFAERAMDIIVNGAPRQLPQDASAATLIDQLELTGQRIAIEVNGEIVPRSEYAKRQIEPDDRVEIIHAVGGG
jgi:sulfur carrier protein